ncbi:hypothetical protein NE237_019965 [Protea cynaroides]|uniref:Uncharacterized protein n=1 Tax=Protea cynaroides TaxID=273540 RepID=A0A9Q0H8I7_9MAGN|nr:hypothetical protein NE237_019965 [Protea cynaroides]
MSAIEMTATIKKLSYKRLINEGEPVDDANQEGEEKAPEEIMNWRARRWFRIRNVGGKRRSKVRIPGLRRLLRRKNKVVSVVRFSWNKVFRRLKESRSYMGDLFAGNYLFTQVNPSSLKCTQKSYMGVGLHGYTSKSYLRKIS